MEYEEIRLIKQSEKSTVHLVREKEGEQTFIRKSLKGQRRIYLTLQTCQHPYLPKLYEVAVSDDVTTVLEEYIEGQSLGSAELTEKQLLGAFRELCSVLEFLHGKDIIHRDIKPSNILLAEDGHIRLIDFDAARMPKEELEQDTTLLGTRGYAPPEQYGFAQTDARADIYALGVTLQQFLGEKARKPRYRRVIQKCTNLDPDKRYRSIRQVRRALFGGRRYALCGAAAVLLFALLCFGARTRQPGQEGAVLSEGELTVLPAPDNPHWDGDTGIAVWGNVPGSGFGDGQVGYDYVMYRMDTETPPDPDTDEWYLKSDMSGNGGIDEETGTYSLNFAYEFEENGFYYYAVSAHGDGETYASSPYVMSDAFAYTGENALALPAPTGFQWRIVETGDDGWQYYATWSNLDDYEDSDSFNVTVYDGDGNYVINNIWTKEYILYRGEGGIKIQRGFLTDAHKKYRFTVEAYSSRPNEYRPFLLSEPIPEEAYSPWLSD